MFNKILRCLKNPYILLSKMIENKGRFISDKTYLSIFYRASFGEFFDWTNPQTYNQKLQWLKLNDRNPLNKKLVDKYEVRQHVSSKIGEEYLIPLLGVWDDFEKINFDELPDQFVLKCTHDSGGVIICKDKSNFNLEFARKKFNKLMKKDYYWSRREWPYKDLKPRIIAEKLMLDDSNEDLKDYKIFTFHGEPKLLFVASDRNKEDLAVKFDYFDTNFERLEFRQAAHDNSDYKIETPPNFKEMLNIAKILSEQLPHLRIDLYNIKGKIYFGEYTFYHHSGLVPFEPEKYDRILGDMIKIDSIEKY